MHHEEITSTPDSGDRGRLVWKMRYKSGCTVTILQKPVWQKLRDPAVVSNQRWSEAMLKTVYVMN